jgi:hypothetical protein
MSATIAILCDLPQPRPSLADGLLLGGHIAVRLASTMQLQYPASAWAASQLMLELTTSNEAQ